MQETSSINQAVHISVPLLVRLSGRASALPLRTGHISARQSGDYQSPFRGRGMEFDESRLYQPGDDIRNIDWRVTARTGKTHTKLYREERERPVFLWVDLRAPMFFATRGKYKSVIASRLASLLAWSAIHHGDRVGGVVFSEAVHHELKPQRGKSAALRLINQLVNHPAWSNPIRSRIDHAAGSRALLRLRRVVRPGSLIFLLSDFRHFDQQAESQLLQLSQHNDVVMIFIHDVLEKTLPPAGRYRISNGQDELMIDTFDKKRVEHYQRQFQQHSERLQQLARKHKIYLLSCMTQDDPFTVLQSGLVARR